MWIALCPFLYIIGSNILLQTFILSLCLFLWLMCNAYYWWIQISSSWYISFDWWIWQFALNWSLIYETYYFCVWLLYTSDFFLIFVYCFDGFFWWFCWQSFFSSKSILYFCFVNNNHESSVSLWESMSDYISVLIMDQIMSNILSFMLICGCLILVYDSVLQFITTLKL